MANLELLQEELKKTQEEIQKIQLEKIKAKQEARLAEEAKKTDADKAAEIQKQIDDAKAFLANIKEN